MSINHFVAHRTLRPGVIRVEAKLDDFAFPAHSHDHFCIGLVLDGEHDCRYGLRRHIVGKGDLMLVNPGEVHDGRPSGRHGRRYSMLEIDTPAFQSMTQAAIRADRFEFQRAVFRHAGARAALAAWLDRLSGTEVNAERDVAALLFGVLAGSGERPEGRAAASRLALRIRLRMREQGAGADSIGELGAELGVSRFRLVRAFKQAFGLTPEDFRRQLRIERARALLAGPGRLVDISLAAGFADQSHMTREFRRLVGLAPGAYRRALR